MKAETLAKYKQGKKLFESGRSIRSICSELKMAHHPFSKWLKENGIEVHNNNDGYEERFEEGMKLYLDGMSLTQVSKKVGSSPKHLSKYLKSKGIEITNPVKVRQMNEDFFKTIDTEEKAYWLGFIYADGYIIEFKRGERVKSMSLGIGLNANDKTHLQKFLNDIEYTNGKITQKTMKGKDEKLHDSVQVVVNNTQMCRDLIKLGVTPRKSHTLTFPSKDIVSDHLLRHFIRGYVDGDGYVGYARNNRLRFGVIGTRWFLEGLMERNSMFNAPIRIDKRSSIPTTNNGIGMSHTRAENILCYLYKDANVYLDRKYNKVLPVIENVE